MDRVFIKQLQVDTVIGVYDWEKTIRQRLVLDLELATDISQAAATDNIRYAVDYAVVTEKVRHLISTEPIQLIETVAERVAQLLLREFATSEVQVTVMKPDAIAKADAVGISITRRKS